MSNKNGIITLTDGNATALIDTLGGEILSISYTQPNGQVKEVMYGGALSDRHGIAPEGKTFSWKWSAPFLHPNPGGVKTKEYILNGIKYAKTQHGPTRSLPFEVIQQTNKSVTLVSESNEETKKFTPDDYYFLVNYKLERGRLTIQKFRRNTGTEKTVFSLGHHPGFALEKPLENYSVVLKDIVLANENLPVTLEEKGAEAVTLNVNNPVISGEKVKNAPGAIMINNIKRATAVLCEVKENGQTEEQLEFEFTGPHMLLWTKPAEKETDVPFLCIEDWQGPSQLYEGLNEKENTTSDYLRLLKGIKQDPKKTFYNTSAITFDIARSRDLSTPEAKQDEEIRRIIRHPETLKRK